jgi:hypothetical protein
MEYEPLKRDYARGSHFNLTAKVTSDKIRWRKAGVGNLSSGGMELHSAIKYDVGETLWFDVTINTFLSEFTVKTQGIVRRVRDGAEGTFICGIQFVGLSQDIKIRIDENVQNDRPVSGGLYSAD